MPICGKNMRYMLFAEICEKSATCEICSNRIICVKMTCLSSMAINDWWIYPRPAAVIYPHTCTLTHCHHRHSCGRAQSCVSVGLVWSFGTITKPRINVFDCRRQIKGICRRCNHFAADVIRCSGVRHIRSFSHTVSCPLMKHIGISIG